MDEWMVGTAFSLLKHDMPKSWDFMCVFFNGGGGWEQWDCTAG